MATRPLRILQVLRAPIGGLFRHVIDLTRELVARGHEVGIVTDSLTSDAQTQHKLDPLRPVAALGIHSFPIPRMLGRGDLTTPFAIRRLAAELQVDVLHGHGAKGGVSARLARIGRKRQVALYTPHGGVLNYRPGSATAKLFQGIERALLPHTDAIIFESAFAQAAFSRIIARPACPAPVIHNGLSASEFIPVELADDARDFVFIGELRPVKGLPILLPALAETTAPDGRPATLVIAGDGPDRAALQEQARALGLSQRVAFLGVQPARRMLALGRCMVVPSLAESLPYVILEAAAAGRPVIATNVGGVGEIFGPTSANLLPAGNTAALRQAMQAFMDDPDRARSEAASRHEFIRTRFSVETMTDKIETVYLDALSRR